MSASDRGCVKTRLVENFAQLPAAKIRRAVSALFNAAGREHSWANYCAENRAA
jgi:hypothetical protein